MKKTLHVLVSIFLFTMPMVTMTQWNPKKYQTEFKRIYTMGHRINGIYSPKFTTMQQPRNAKPQEQLKLSRERLNKIEIIINQLYGPYKDQAIANLKFRIRALENNR